MSSAAVSLMGATPLPPTGGRRPRPEPEHRALPVYEAGAVRVPYVIHGMDELVAHDTAWEPHAHPTHELLWNERGSSVVRVGRRSWTIAASAGMWLPAGTLHTGYAPAGTWYRTAQFSVEAVPAIAEGPVAIEITELLRLLLDRLADEALGEASRRLTEALIVDVLRPAPVELLVDLPEEPLLGPIVAAVDADPGDRRSLADWAEALGVSARTLTRAFRSGTGLGFSGWTAAMRAQRAVALLAAGHELEDIAEQVGYRSVSAFGAAFRRTTGLTPGAFRPKGAGQSASR